MKKLYVIAAVAMAALMLSCSKEAQTPETHPAEEATGVITINATLADLNTKVAFTPVYTDNKTTSMTLTWADGDKLRVYNHADPTQYSDFDLAAGSIGQKTGSFSGTPVTAASYDVEIINGAVDFGAQTQPSDGVTSDLKYMAQASEVTNLASISFTEFSSVLSITAQMPSTAVAAKVKSVDITASEAIFNSGNTLTITLGAPGDADADGILHLFANLPVGDKDIPAGTTLLMHFNAPGEAHDVYTRFVELPATTFKANKLNTINVNASQSDKHAGPTSCDGSNASKAYLIGDKYQMDAMHNLMKAGETKYFKLVDDIDMDEVVWAPLNNTPDGEGKFNKYIYFDGNGHKISNISTDDTTIPYYPSIFGVLNGTVKDLAVDHATIIPSTTSTDKSKAAVLAAYIGSSDSEVVPSVSNITITNSTVGSTTAKGKKSCAILASWVDKAGTAISDIAISNCVVACADYAGGMIAEMDEQTTISGTNVVSNTDVYGTLAGGVVGFANALTTMSGCTFTGGTVTNTARYGGLMLGSTGDYESVISDCHVRNATLDVTSVSTTDPRSGGFCGMVQKKVTIKGCTVGEESKKVIIKLGTPSAAAKKLNSGGFAGCSYGTITKNGDVRSKAFVTITCTNPSAETNANYELNLGGFTGYHSGTIEYSDAVVDMTGICGKYVGGFCGLLTGGTIRNSTVSGTVSGNNGTGGLIGYANSSAATVTDCSSSAVVTRTGTWGGSFGSFAGIIDNTTITRCSATSDIDVNANYVGGFIGGVETTAAKTATISQCYSSGSVSSSSAQCGGFIGHIAANSDGTVIVTDCYETGNLTGGNQRKGGLIGQINSGKVTVSKCYSTASLSGSFAQGGLVGFMNGTATITDCAAWNTSVTAASVGNGNWSSGAVIGVAWPIGTFTNNYRRPDLSIKAYWGNVTGYTKELAASYDHPDVSSTSPLIVVDKTDGSTLRATTATSAASGQDNFPLFAYHGKHVASGTSLSTLASTTLGWSSEVWDFTEDLPRLKWMLP